MCVKQISPEWALAAAEVAAREDDFTDEDSEIDSDEEHQLDGDADGSSYDKVERSSLYYRFDARLHVAMSMEMIMKLFGASP